MNPTTDELIKEFREHACKTNKEGHCIEIMILVSKLRGRLDVLEEIRDYLFPFKTDNNNLFNVFAFCEKEIAKIKEVLK